MYQITGTKLPQTWWVLQYKQSILQKYFLSICKKESYGQEKKNIKLFQKKHQEKHNHMIAMSSINIRIIFCPLLIFCEYFFIFLLDV